MKQVISMSIAACALLLASCKKDVAGASLNPLTDAKTLIEKPTGKVLVVNPLLVNLEGEFEFNNNLKDKMGKLVDGVSTKRLVSYTNDRKGNTHSAIKFDGTYGVRLFNVPVQTHMSVSLWAKYDKNNLGNGRFLVLPKSNGVGVDRTYGNFYGGSVLSSTDGSIGLTTPNVSGDWHHLVVTYDSSIIRLYLDANLVTTRGSGNPPLSFPKMLQEYNVGYAAYDNEMYVGVIDDVRFYSRVLNQSDITALYKL